MSTLFPTSIPAYNQNSGQNNTTDTLAQNQHTSRHQQHQDDIIAIATKVGTGSSTAANNQVLRGTGTGSTAFDTVHLATDTSGTLPVSNGGTGVTTSTGSGNVVLSSSPTISNATLSSQPTITDFTNANHNHQNVAGGGTLTTAALQNASVTPDKLSTGTQTGTVATGETTTSTSYAQLATKTDVVTVTIGANGIALVAISANITNNTGGASSFMSFTASGTNTIAAADAISISFLPGAGTQVQTCGAPFVLTALTPGSTTFTAEYRVTSNTGTFSNRRIGVVPL